MLCDQERNMSNDINLLDSDVMAYLFTQVGPDVPLAPRRSTASTNFFPLADWHPRNQGRDFGISWTSTLGPSIRLTAEVANSPLPPAPLVRQTYARLTN